MKKLHLAAMILAGMTFGMPTTGAYAAQGKTSCGSASWYALKSRTASGEMMNPAAMTAAHKTLPIGTKVKVTNLKNSKSVVVRINDRGPFVRGRLIDLSKGAAQKLGFIGAGHARVQIEPADGSGTRDCA